MLLGLLAIVTAGVLLAAELGLRLLGYGHPTDFFVPLGDGKTLTTNPRFGWQFTARGQATQPYPVLLAATKAPGAHRIFVVGDSAAQGTPAPAFGFVRQLEILLQGQHPGEQFEVINAAMRGINSHVARRIARDCAKHQPDLILVYLGNNEAIGLYAPEPDGFNLAAYPGLLRAREWARRTRLAQCVDAFISRRRAAVRPAEGQDAGFFRSRRMAADDPRREGVFANFRSNLGDICAAGAAAGAAVVLSTVGSNLRDFPPLASVHRPGLSAGDLAAWEQHETRGREAEAAGRIAEALTQYQTAVGLDGHYAELHFRLGRCLLASGETPAAVEHYRLARDWDALPFRATERLNEVIRETARRRQGENVTLVDVEHALAGMRREDQGLPGRRWFYEHVHYRFAGDYAVACTLLPVVVGALGLPSSSSEPLSEAACAAALAYTPWDDLQVKSAMLRLTARPPFTEQLEHSARQAAAEQAWAEESRSFELHQGAVRSLEGYRQAVGRRPADWAIRSNFAALLEAAGKHAEAAEEYAAAVHRMPVFAALRVPYAQVLARLGRPNEAIVQLEEALRLQPDLDAAKEGLKRLRAPP